MFFLIFCSDDNDDLLLPLEEMIEQNRKQKWYVDFT